MPRGREAAIAIFFAASALLTVSLLLWLNQRVSLGTTRYGNIGRDFLIFWQASRLTLQGNFATLFDPVRFVALMRAAVGGSTEYMSFAYPPHALWVMAPLALLPYPVSLALWWAATFAAFAWSLRRSFRHRWQGVLVLLLAPASLFDLAFGQTGFLSAALMSAGLLLLDEQPMLAGMLIGLLSFKPQLGVLLPFALIAGGHYRTFAVAVATTFILIGGSVLVIGTGPWLEFLDGASRAQLNLLDHGVGIFRSMMPSCLMAARLLALPLWLGYVAQSVAALGAVIAACWGMRQPVPLPEKAAILMIGTLLATPYSFTYDMVLLVAAQVLVRPRGWLEWTAQAMAWILPVLMVPFGLLGVPIAPLVLLTLFYCLLRRLAAPAAARAETVVPAI